MMSDPRFSLPNKLTPRASVQLTITVATPSPVGNMVLEYQMVKAFQFWFGQFADVNTAVPTWNAGYSVSGTPSFFFNDTATTEIYTLSLHDALPISAGGSSPVHLGVHFATSG